MISCLINLFSLSFGNLLDSMGNSTVTFIPMVDGKTFNGSLQWNPFNFQHFNYNYLALYVDSTQMPSRPLTPDFKIICILDRTIRYLKGAALISMTQVTLFHTRNIPTVIAYAAFDLPPDLSCNEPHWNIIKSGTLRAEIRFAEALTTTVNLIIFAEFDNIIEVNKNRNIILDYSS